MKDNTPQAVQAAHELVLWLIPQIDQFPRVRRFTLGDRLETGLLEVLELTVEAAFTHNKRTALRFKNQDNDSDFMLIKTGNCGVLG